MSELPSSLCFLVVKVKDVLSAFFVHEKDHNPEEQFCSSLQLMLAIPHRYCLNKALLWDPCCSYICCIDAIVPSILCTEMQEILSMIRGQISPQALPSAQVQCTMLICNASQLLCKSGISSPCGTENILANLDHAWQMHVFISISFFPPGGIPASFSRPHPCLLLLHHCIVPGQVRALYMTHSGCLGPV